MPYIVPTLSLDDADDAMISTAVDLLNKSATNFLTQDGSKLTRLDPLSEHATPRNFAAQTLTWLLAMHEAKTIGREDLEAIFHCAEEASLDEPREPTAITKVLYGLWDGLDAKLPELHVEAFEGAGGVSGDYGRVRWSRTVVRVTKDSPEWRMAMRGEADRENHAPD